MTWKENDDDVSDDIGGDGFVFLAMNGWERWPLDDARFEGCLRL